MFWVIILMIKRLKVVNITNIKRITNIKKIFKKTLKLVKINNYKIFQIKISNPVGFVKLELGLLNEQYNYS